MRRVRDRAGVIERQHLCAHQIVACFNICWDNTGLWEVVQAQTIRTEHAVHKTVFGHLEPAVTGTDGGGGVGDLLHVDCTRTLVGVICDAYRDGAVFKRVVGRRDIWICSPFEGNCVAGYEGISGYELKWEGWGEVRFMVHFEAALPLTMLQAMLSLSRTVRGFVD